MGEDWENSSLFQRWAVGVTLTTTSFFVTQVHLQLRPPGLSSFLAVMRHKTDSCFSSRKEVARCDICQDTRHCGLRRASKDPTANIRDLPRAG